MKPARQLDRHSLEGVWLLLVAVWFATAAPLHISGQTPSTNSPPALHANLLVMAQGSVEILRVGTNRWATVRGGAVLNPGDRVRTGERSRAELYLGTGMTIQKGELSEIEIPPTPQATFRKGLFKIFNREPDARSKFGLPNTTTAAIRGTDFLVEVDAAGNSRITVLDGLVMLGNPQGELLLGPRDSGLSETGRPPVKSSVVEAENDLIQWNLYYPGVLDPAAMPASPGATAALKPSLDAYNSGDLVGAATLFPWDQASSTPTERLYRAALLVGVGQVARAQELLSHLPEEQGRPLRRLIQAVKLMPAQDAPPPTNASEWLAESYVEQSRHRLEAARTAARAAVTNAPGFGFAWARLAELEFGFGRREQTLAALDRAEALTPSNAQAVALRGFVLAAAGRMKQAMDAFDRAIAMDGALANAWLGRGLCSMHAGSTGDGLRDLMVAASLEPQRSILRSYLAKAFAIAGDRRHASNELRLAIAMDPRDPTPWLYSALMRQQEHRFNEGIADLQLSQSLNDNRRIYRSRQLLDQDRAVRSANLARLYDDAGMADVARREAASAVVLDPANYSAHLFLADSFDTLRDPARFNLRHETVWFNELLLANILAPPGAGRLSQGISAQEYSRLFDADRLGVAASSLARSDGVFQQRASQFGSLGGTDYALDLDYRHQNGTRPNNGLDAVEWYTTVKQRLGPDDSVLVLAKYQDYSSGDNFQYFDPSQARPEFSFDERQDPILALAWHHQWSEGVHTLLLGGRLVNDQRLRDRAVPQIVLLEDAGGTVVGSDTAGVDVDYRSSLEIYSAELSQVVDGRLASLTAGARYQSGSFRTHDLLESPTQVPFLFTDPPARGASDDTFERATAYSYLTLKPHDSLRLIGGLAWDGETFPRNFRHPPITGGTERLSQLGPKAGFLWSPLQQATLRGMYTRSLGGVSLDESYRLEPTQLAGFPQSFRTLIPESMAGIGSVSAPEHETLGLALDLRLGRTTFAGIQADRLTSAVRRHIGVFVAENGNIPSTPGAIREHLDFVEQSVGISVHQLIGDTLAAGARYSLTQAELDDTYPGTESSILSPADPSQRSTLHTTTGYLLLNHPSGFFTRLESRWYHQSNSGYAPDRPGEDVIQENLYVGYRFPRSHGQVRIGLLNLGGGGYRLNPLTAFDDLPRKRVVEARLSLMF